MLVAEGAKPAHELGRSRQEAALALDRLDHDRRHLLGRDVRHERPLERRQRLGATRAAVVLRERHAIDLGRERPQPGLVGMGLRRERHREERPPVEAALERDHRRPARVAARELDRVLDRLGAGVEERGLRRPGDRNGAHEALRESGVDLVRDDREVGVHEALGLLLHRRDQLRVRMADVETADAAGEVDERVAVDVDERGASALACDDRVRDRERSRDDARDPLQDLGRARARNLGPEVDRPRHRHRPHLSEGPGSMHSA